MKTALVFSTQGTIDFFEVRNNVLRIPEVISTIKEAQNSVDTICPNPIDLLSFMNSDDSKFWANEKFRKLCVSLVQIGLARRYYKKSDKADVLVAPDNHLTAVNVINGSISLKEFVETSLFQKADNTFHLATGVMPQKLNSFVNTDEGYEQIEFTDNDINKVINHLREEQEVKRFINVGPCNTLVSTTSDEIVFFDVQVEEMINMDPMLSWFWASLNTSNQQVAN